MSLSATAPDLPRCYSRTAGFLTHRYLPGPVTSGFILKEAQLTSTLKPLTRQAYVPRDRMDAGEVAHGPSGLSRAHLTLCTVYTTCAFSLIYGIDCARHVMQQDGKIAPNVLRQIMYEGSIRKYRKYSRARMVNSCRNSWTSEVVINLL
jgi:hypothetical protein